MLILRENCRNTQSKYNKWQLMAKVKAKQQKQKERG